MRTGLYLGVTFQCGWATLSVTIQYGMQKDRGGGPEQGGVVWGRRGEGRSSRGGRGGMVG